MAVTAYRYGVPHWVRLPDSVDAQLRLAHSLAQDLVRLDQKRRERIAAVWSSEPAIATIEDAITRAEAEASELAPVVTRRPRARDRPAADDIPTQEGAEQLRAVRASIRELREHRRTRIATVRERHGDTLRQITSDHRAAVKNLYAIYCQGDPAARLYWAVYNDVGASHRLGVARVDSARRRGQGAALRFRRFDGGGVLAVQLQREAKDPARTPARIADPSGPWANVLRLPWTPPAQWQALSRSDRKRRQLGTALVRVGAGPIELPVIMHRMMPEDAEITGARLVVRRVGGHRKVSLQVTARIPEPEPVLVDGGLPTVALHLGWRREGDAVRVATWRASSPVQVPEHLGAWVVAHTATAGEIRAPGRWLARVASHNERQTERTGALESIRKDLLSWLAVHEHPVAACADPDPDHPRHWVTAAAVRTWRAADFARLALAWRDWRPELNDAAGMAAALEAWRRADRRLWEPQAHGREGALAARDDAYRKASAWLAEQCCCLVLDDTEIGQLARRDSRSEDPDHAGAGIRAARAARFRTLVAPGRLREMAAAAAERRGVEVRTVKGRDLSRTHHRCGHVNPADGRYAASHLVACDGCGQTYDQDLSASQLMVAAGPSGQFDQPR
jgi:hypothetical protein